MADRSGKTDMERIGLFQEMNYVSIGDRYVPRWKHVFNESANIGRQVLPGGSKEISGLQHGYFDVKFNRIFESEAWSDPVSIRRRFRMEQKKKDIGKPFLPANGPKMTCGKGTFFGTIGGPVTAFSPLSKSTGPRVAPLRNVFTNPGRHGTGYGYANVTLSPYPGHSVDPYTSAKEKMQIEIKNHKSLLKGGAFRLSIYPEAYFNLNPYKMDKNLPPVKKKKEAAPVDLRPFRPSNPGKKMGGGKFGTFDPYPSHSTDAYKDSLKKVIKVVNTSGKLYIPPPGPKSRPVNSIVTQNVLRCMNINNYRTMEPLTPLLPG